MNLTKIHVTPTKMVNCPITKKLFTVSSDILILVPDLDSFHEVKGQEMLLNKKWEVHLLEPGKELRWLGMYSPWHLNTDSYRLTFTDHIAVYTPRP
ncbi:gp6 [Shigella virus Moo19]|uniref:Uncharacterized protein n=1 Tax=Shigella virus Moo19 TaxID=2886042 RepID=A0AAE9C5C5_9CAUD|nr:gp6 [Shigella virus Moo19]UEN68802.1 hypothetical protein Moo19_gp6 [Shigella virus Moo19]